MKHAFRAAVAVLLSLSASSGAAFAQDAPAAPVERYFLLLFDSPLGGIRQMDEVSVAVEEWLSHELLPTDAAAVVSYYGQELQVAQDFTRDRQALSEAVGAAVRGQAHASAPAEAGCPSLLERMPAAQDLSHRTASFYGALQALAETVDSVPGPKGLLVFSKGFGRPRSSSTSSASSGLSEPFSEILAGPELGISEEVLAESPVLEKYLPEQGLFEPTLEALESRQIRLYPVDLATDYSETFPLAGVMSRLAAETGGRYVYPVTELPRILVQIAQTGTLGGEQQALTPAPSFAPLRAGIQSE